MIFEKYIFYLNFCVEGKWNQEIERNAQIRHGLTDDILTI